MAIILYVEGDPGVSFHASAFPEWCVYVGLLILVFLVGVVWKGKRNNNPKNKK